MRMMHRGIELQLVVDPAGGGFFATVVMTWPAGAGRKAQVQEFGPFDSIIQALTQGALQARAWADLVLDAGMR